MTVSHTMSRRSRTWELKAFLALMLVTSSMVLSGEMIRSTYWIPRWVDLSFSATDVLFNVSEVIPMPCLLTCTASSECLAMHYDVVTRRCYGVKSFQSQGTVSEGGKYRYFIKDQCSSTENVGHYYQIVRIPLTHASALQYCQERGGHLVRTETSEEMECLTDLIKKQVAGNWGYWTDITDHDVEGDYRYSNGVKVVETFWRPKEPNLAWAFSDDCLAAYCISSTCAWDDIWCGEKFQFICEYGAL